MNLMMGKAKAIDRSNDRNWETFSVSEFRVCEEVDSRVRPGVKISYEVGIRCPACERVLDKMEHGEWQRCWCGQYMERWDNALECKV